MNSLRPPDVSLYELAASSDPQLQPLQLSPTTFKSAVELLIDLLLEQQLPATIWLKLPRGDVWQSEMERFYQSAAAPCRIYNLQTYPNSPSRQRRSSASAEFNHSASSSYAGLPNSTHSTANELHESIQTGLLNNGEAEQFHLGEDKLTRRSDAPDDTTVTLYNLPLATDSQLKREYFILVISPEFYGLMLAHRPRSVRHKVEPGLQESASTTAKLGQVMEEALDQKHPLLGLCSFDQAMIKLVLEGVNRAISFGQPDTASSAEMAELLVSWEDLVTQGTTDTLSPLLMGRLLTKQIHRQEEIWRSGAVYRRQADQSEALRQENEELLAALRLKDEFVQTMGQELRTPLTNMKTALSLLNSPHLKPPQRQRYMDMISRECDRQSSLITSVLDLVQLEGAVEQAPMEPLRLSDIVPGVVSTYQPLAQEKGLMLGYTIPEELPPISCANQWLKQIVINLLHNSIKFTPSGGQVWVRARQQGDSIQVEFRDTGIGIAQAEIPKIFNRFYRVRGAGEDSSGAGLGLSIVQQLLLRCGGSISVKSKPGEGSVFSILLPAYDATEEAPLNDRVGSSQIQDD